MSQGFESQERILAQPLQAFQELSLRSKVLGFMAAGASIGAPVAATSPETVFAQEPTPVVQTENPCFEEGTNRPSNLQGRYLSFKPNNHLYRISFTAKALSSDCAEDGSRTFRVYQESKINDKWGRNSSVTTVKSDGKKNVAFSTRAPHFCEKSGINGVDRRDKTVGRTTVEAIYRTVSGKVEKEVHHTKPSRLCK